MAAGLSQSQKYGRTYRRLKSLQRELINAGITWAEYKDGKVRATADDGRVTVTTGINWSSMSNGESVGLSYVMIDFRGGLGRPSEVYSTMNFERGWKRAIFLLTSSVKGVE